MTTHAKESNDRICFVIMPITDSEGYSAGHFKRVYEHIIKPACIKAGFNAVRADDVQKTNIIIVDVLQKIISAEMCICDLSSRNPNVLYELGIRQAFGLPVTLIKDNKTPRIFDIQGIRDIEYDENLRIDIVEERINELCETITQTYESKDKEIKSLIQVLNVKPAEISGELKISQETSLILDQLKSLNSKINEIENKVAPIINYPIWSPQGTQGYSGIGMVPTKSIFGNNDYLGSHFGPIAVFDDPIDEPKKNKKKKDLP
jgi:hypothetical protein